MTLITTITEHSLHKAYNPAPRSQRETAEQPPLTYPGAPSQGALDDVQRFRVQPAEHRRPEHSLHVYSQRHLRVQ